MSSLNDLWNTVQRRLPLRQQGGAGEVVGGGVYANEHGGAVDGHHHHHAPQPQYWTGGTAHGRGVGGGGGDDDDAAAPQPPALPPPMQGVEASPRPTKRRGRPPKKKPGEAEEVAGKDRARGGGTAALSEAELEKRFPLLTEHAISFDRGTDLVTNSGGDGDADDDVAGGGEIEVDEQHQQHNARRTRARLLRELLELNDLHSLPHEFQYRNSNVGRVVRVPSLRSSDPGKNSKNFNIYYCGTNLKGNFIEEMLDVMSPDTAQSADLLCRYMAKHHHESFVKAYPDAQRKVRSLQRKSKKKDRSDEVASQIEQMLKDEGETGGLAGFHTYDGTKDDLVDRSRDSSARDLFTVEWNLRYRDLVNFHASHHHTIVSQSFGDGRLAVWTAKMRRYKRRKLNCLNNRRIELLDELGFVWSAAEATALAAEYYEGEEGTKKKKGDALMDDPRIVKAALAKLWRPDLTLPESLVMGGYAAADEVDDEVDEDDVKGEDDEDKKRKLDAKRRDAVRRLVSKGADKMDEEMQQMLERLREVDGANGGSEGKEDGKDNDGDGDEDVDKDGGEDNADGEKEDRDDDRKELIAEAFGSSNLDRCLEVLRKSEVRAASRNPKKKKRKRSDEPGATNTAAGSIVMHDGSDPSVPSNVEWNLQYGRLLDFKAKNGHVFVSVVGRSAVGHWVAEMRTAKQKKSTVLTPRRRELLDEIGFVFDTNPSATAAAASSSGKAASPIRAGRKGAGGDPRMNRAVAAKVHFPLLKYWEALMAGGYGESDARSVNLKDALKKRKKSFLDPSTGGKAKEEVQKVLTVLDRAKEERAAGGDAPMAGYDDAAIREAFGEESVEISSMLVRAALNRRGKAPTNAGKASTNTGAKNRQTSAGKVAPFQIEFRMFDGLDESDTKAKEWNAYYYELLKYKHINGNCHANTGTTALGRWVARMRASKKRKAKVLTPRRIELLDEIGFAWAVHLKGKRGSGGSSGDERMDRALAAKIAYPTLFVGECLIMGGFSEEESKSGSTKNLLKRLRRTLDEEDGYVNEETERMVKLLQEDGKEAFQAVFGNAAEDAEKFVSNASTRTWVTETSVATPSKSSSKKISASSKSKKKTSTKGKKKTSARSKKKTSTKGKRKINSDSRPAKKRRVAASTAEI